MTTSRETTSCPFTNICGTSGDVRTCSQDMRLLPPLPPAEDLCIDALEAQFEKMSKGFNLTDDSSDAAKLIVKLGDLRLEQGLNPSVSPAVAATYLDEAVQYFQLANVHPNQAPPLRRKVENLITYLPAFEARRNVIDHERYDKARSAPPEAHLTQIQREIAHRAFDLESIEPAGKLGLLALSGASLLLARRGRLDYPTTKRERGSADESGAFKQQSHTTYSIVEGHKLPSRYRYRDPGVDTVLDLRRVSVSLSHSIARHAANTNPGILKARSEGVYTGIVVRLLVDEVLGGRPVQGGSLALLNLLSDDLIARQDNLLRSIKNQSK